MFKQNILGFILSTLTILVLMVFLSTHASAQSVVHTNQLPTGPVNSNITLTGQGDGYRVIPYQNRFYYMAHHTFPYVRAMGCIERQPGSGECAGFGDQQVQPGVRVGLIPDGDPNAAGTPARQLGSSTSSANEEYEIVGGRYLFYPVTRFNANTFGNPPRYPMDWGMGCFDMQLNAECGYTLASTNPNNRDFRVGIEGPFKVGNKLYLLDLEMNLYCFNTTPSSPIVSACATPSLNLHTNPDFLLPRYTRVTNSKSGHIGGEVVGNKLYLTVNYDTQQMKIFPPGTVVSNSDKAAVCIDMAGGSMSKCASWPNTATFSTPDTDTNVSNFIAYTPSMTPNLLCNANRIEISCLSLANGSNMTSSAPAI